MESTDDISATTRRFSRSKIRVLPRLGGSNQTMAGGRRPNCGGNGCKRKHKGAKLRGKTGYGKPRSNRGNPGKARDSRSSNSRTQRIGKTSRLYVCVEHSYRNALRLHRLLGRPPGSVGGNPVFYCLRPQSPIIQESITTKVKPRPKGGEKIHGTL